MTLITAGIDIGTGAVKAVLMRHEGDAHQWLGKRVERIRRRDPLVLARENYETLLAETGIDGRDVLGTVLPRPDWRRLRPPRPQGPAARAYFDSPRAP